MGCIQRSKILLYRAQKLFHTEIPIKKHSLLFPLCSRDSRWSFNRQVALKKLRCFSDHFNVEVRSHLEQEKQLIGYIFLW
jgi:hypothetical protein